MTIDVPRWSALRSSSAPTCASPPARCGCASYDRNGHPIRRTFVDLEPFLDCTYARFEFDPVDGFGERTYGVEFELVNARPETVISVFEITESGPEAEAPRAGPARGARRRAARRADGGSRPLPDAGTTRPAAAPAWPERLDDPGAEGGAAFSRGNRAPWAQPAAPGRALARIALGLEPAVRAGPDAVRARVAPRGASARDPRRGRGLRGRGRRRAVP
jgi:hypothetical protein